MKILYFGYYKPSYSRNSIIMKALKSNGVEILECQDDSPGIKKFFKLFQKHWKMRNTYDVMIVGFLGHLVVPLAKLITRKPVIFDAFVSLYEANVQDRKLYKDRSLEARYYWFLDWLSMHMADMVLFDTNEHINFASKEFGVKKSKFRRVFVGADDEVFVPIERPGNKDFFSVLFYGSYIPQHGIEYIVKAAKKLESVLDIKFTIIGTGQEKSKINKLARDSGVKNIEFLDPMPLANLARYISLADVCLGIFGENPKSHRVIVNKVFQCAAMKKPIITADTPAVRELFGDDDVMLIKIANEDSLTKSILKLKDDPNLSNRLAENAYRQFKNHALPAVIGKALKEEISKLL